MGSHHAASPATDGGAPLRRWTAGLDPVCLLPVWSG